MEDTNRRLQGGSEISTDIHLGHSVYTVHVGEQEIIIASLL